MILQILAPGLGMGGSTPSGITFSVSDVANANDVVGCVVFTPPANQLSPDPGASQRTRHNQQRHARAEAGYVGQTSIDTLGTVNTGTWRGEPIARPYLEVITSVTVCIYQQFLPAYTYDNGNSGIGATITFNSPATVTIDGWPIRLGDTVLIPGARATTFPTAAIEAGVYIVTTVPAAGVAAVLTRHPGYDDKDQLPGALISVAKGTYAASLWIYNDGFAGANIIIGTTALEFSLVWTHYVPVTGTYPVVGGVGIAVTPSANTSGYVLSTVALNVPVVVANGGTGATTATVAFDNLSPLTTLGDLIYDDGTHNVRLAGNTTATKKFLVQTGTGAVSAAPSWGTIALADLPTLPPSPVLFDRYLSQTGTSYFSVAALTAIYTLSIPGGTLGTNKVIRVRIAGTYTYNSGTPTTQLQVVYGATTIWDATSAAMAASAIPGAFEIELTLAAADASTAKQVMTGSVFWMARAAATTGTGAWNLLNTAAASAAVFFFTATEDSTATKSLVVNFKPSVNNAAVGLTVYSIVTELLN